MKRGRNGLALIVAGLLALPALAQTTSGPVTGTSIDACGTIIQGTSCQVFSGGGGTWYLANYGPYRIGDSVRVVGVINTDCSAFCKDIDGCITGNEIYSSDVNPCGTSIPSFPGDALNSVCSSLGTTATGLTLIGMWLTWPGRRTRRKWPDHF